MRVPNKGELVAIDLEIFQQQEPLHIPTGNFACISIAYEGGEKYQFYNHEDLQTIMDTLKGATLVMHNALYDLRQLRRWAHVKQSVVWDTMIVERDLFGGFYDTFSLDALSRRWRNKGLHKAVREEFQTATEMTPAMKEYALEDAVATLECAEHQRKWADTRGFNLSWYWDIDEPTIWAVLDMEPAHIVIQDWLDMSARFADVGEDIETELGFNVYSHVQVKKEIRKKVGKQLASTNAKTVLEPLMETLKGDEKEFIGQILKARMYRKASNTYGKLWPERWADENGNIIPSWKVTGTETGRMSCASPNLMNIPSRKLPEFRDQFISKHKDGKILIADVSQQEPRILAFFSKDKALLRAFEQDEDIYEFIANEIDATRNFAKEVHLGLSYGLSKFGLARNAKISKKKAKEVIDTYFSKFTGIRAYITSKRNEAKRKEFVQTSTGRPIWMNLHSRKWENNAINAPIQGSAADHTKLTMVLIHRNCKQLGIPFTVIMAVHDELVLDIPAGMEGLYEEITRDAWIKAGEVVAPGVPMKVDISIGDSWGAK